MRTDMIQTKKFNYAEYPFQPFVAMCNKFDISPCAFVVVPQHCGPS